MKCKFVTNGKINTPLSIDEVEGVYRFSDGKMVLFYDSNNNRRVLTPYDGARIYILPIREEYTKELKRLGFL